MGNMYNIMHGKNPLSGILLQMLNLTEAEVGRFRDTRINEDGTQIIVFTRNGGGNRDHWDDDKDAGIDCDCPGCIIGYKLPEHPQYIRDEDDDFDCTYASIYFRVPEEWIDLAKSLATGKPEPDLCAKTEKKLSEIKQMTSNQMREKYPTICGLFDSIEKHFASPPPPQDRRTDDTVSDI